MAAENNKNLDSVDADPELAAKVGDGGNTSGVSLPPFLKHPRKELIVGAGVLGVLIIAVVVLSITGVLHTGPKVYAEVAGHKIYKSDIETMQTRNDVSDKVAATVLADKYLAEAMAKEHGVTISKTEIKAQGCPNQQTSPYGYQNCVNQLYFTELASNNEGVYQGEAIIANFGRYIPYQSPLLAEYKKRSPKVGDPAAIAADRAYAQNFITGLYDQIKAGKISFDQAIQAEHNNPVLGAHTTAYLSQPHSTAFDGPLSQISLLSAPTIRDKLTSMKAGELSEPFAVAVSNSATDPKSTVESYFLLVKMDQVPGGKSTDMTFQQELAKDKKQLGYKINV